MARKNRVEIYVPERPHHIVLRGNNRRVLFRDRDRSRERFVEWLYDAAHRYECLLHALVLMSNHVHLVATAMTVLQHSKFVQSVSQRFAQWHNRTRGGSGCLFEERHYTKALADDSHTAALLPYVDLNAVRAGMVESPLAWEWSTHALYAGMPALSPLDPTRFTRLGWYETLGADDVARAAAYRAWVEARRDAPAPDPILPRLERWSEERWKKSERWIRRPDGTRVCEDVAPYRAGLRGRR